MASYDIEKLIEESFSGDPPGSAFRARVLKESMAAFSRGRRAHVRRRLVQFGLAAAFIAGASFLLGRYLAPRSVTARPEPVAAESTETVMVSRELVAWLEAASLFRQLGMEDRMTRAVDRAGKLLPADIVTAPSGTGTAFAGHSPVNEARKKPLDWVDRRGGVASGECLNWIIAQSLGD
jgi:hypothetical protein